ncbi:MAG: MFS transporter [Sneathiella sp.]
MANSAPIGNSDNDLPVFLDSSYSWFRLVVSVVLATIGSAGMWSIIVIIPKIQAEYGIDRAEASLPFTTIMIGFGAGNFLVGKIVDRHGIALPLFISALLLSSGFYLSTVVTDIWQFSLVQGLMIGLGTSTFFGPLMSDISHWFHRRLGIAIAAAASGNYFAGAIWPFFLKDIVVDEGWREAYILVSIIILTVLAPLTLLLRKRRPSHPSSPGEISANIPATRKKSEISPRTLQSLLVIAGIACCVAMSMPQVHIVAYCSDLGFGIARGAEMLSLMLVGGIISRLASGILADYIGGLRTLLIGSILQCTALFLYIPFDGLVSLYVVSFVFGLSQGGIVPSYAIVIREFLPAREAGQRVGLVIFATVIGMALGGWLSGLIFDLTRSYQAAFINGIAWNFVNMFIIGAILWKTKNRLLATA